MTVPEPVSNRDSMDEEIVFVEDGPEEGVPESGTWPVLVVDDDAEVHHATEYALRSVRIMGRALRLSHAYSASEAREILERHTDFVAILLDVVMETSDAGLRLVDHIRNVLRQTDIRIILRTGQPGYAPELEVFERYDINDYRTKSELNLTRLVTTLMAAIRSYHQIRTISENRRGLEMIVHATANLMELRAISAFAEGVLTQIASLLDLPVDGVVCAQRGISPNPQELHIVGAAGRLSRFINQPLTELHEDDIREQILHTIEQRHHQFGQRSSVLYLPNEQKEGAIYLRTTRELSTSDRSLLEVFTANIAACYNNVRLVEELHHVAFHDLLTGLHNHAGFVSALDHPGACGPEPVVALIDLAHFHDVNDGLGQDFGNSLLRAVARRLSEQLPGNCRLGRIDRDVFAVIGPDSVINPCALSDLFRTPVPCEGNTLPVAVTLGLCRVQEPAVSGRTLLRRANIALNQAKFDRHTRYAYFSPDMEEAPRERLVVIGHLHYAFEQGHLRVWYQPQVELQNQNVSGMEALLRWPQGNGFAYPPSVFIPLADYSGLIVDIGLWVLDQSCKLFMATAGLPHAPPRVSVNASLAQFRSTDFVEQVAAILEQHRMKPSQLELEITEDLAMDEPEQVLSTLTRLHQLGVHIALDDFGTGYSSLSRLDLLPIGTLKIDRVFIEQIEGSGNCPSIETIVSLGRRLKMTTIAEGVETIPQASYLRDIGCEVAQGYLFARPMPESALLEWLKYHAPLQLNQPRT